MSIKRVFQTGMALLLVLSMLVSFAACNKDDTQTPTGTTENNETDSPDENSLAFPKTDLKSDFNILYPEWGLYADHFFATEEQAGETMADAILERSDLDLRLPWCRPVRYAHSYARCSEYPRHLY